MASRAARAAPGNHGHAVAAQTAAGERAAFDAAARKERAAAMVADKAKTCSKIIL